MTTHVLADLNLRKVFVAGPFIKIIDPATGRMPPAEQALVEGLLSHFEATGARVFNAHRRERWGADMLEPLVFTKLDYDEVTGCELLVVMPGSPGTRTVPLSGPERVAARGLAAAAWVFFADTGVHLRREGLPSLTPGLGVCQIGGAAGA